MNNLFIFTVEIILDIFGSGLWKDAKHKCRYSCLQPRYDLIQNQIPFSFHPKQLNHLQIIGDGRLNSGLPQLLKSDITQPDSLESRIKELRSSLDSWKEVIIPIYKFLIWEKQWYPLAIIGASNAVFMFLWLSETNILTIIAVFGLIVTLCDYLVPAVLSSLVRSDKWTREKENILEGICGDIMIYKTKIEVNCTTYCNMRATNPKMYFALTTLSLIFLAWMGNSINNMFLMYLGTTFLLLYPGIEYNGFSHRFKEMTTKLLRDYVNPRFQNAKKEN